MRAGKYVKSLAVGAAFSILHIASSRAMPIVENNFHAAIQKADSLRGAKKIWGGFGWRFPRSSAFSYEERYFGKGDILRKGDFAYVFILRKQYDFQYCKPVEKGSLGNAVGIIAPYLNENSVGIIILLDNPDFAAITALAKNLPVPVFVLPKNEGGRQKMRAFDLSGEVPDAFKKGAKN